jgi:glycine dehydrogenase
MSAAHRMSVAMSSSTGSPASADEGTSPLLAGLRQAAKAATPFAERHIGPSGGEQGKMLAALGFTTLDELSNAAVPGGIRAQQALNLPAPVSEQAALVELRALAGRNSPTVAMIGLGYYDTITPPVVARNVLENPAWYTAYTPYQPEISQGRLEALINFQTMIGELTGLPTANASLLDEATAVAEAVAAMRRAAKSAPPKVVLDAQLLPQTIAVVATRCEPIGVEVVVADLDADGLPAGPLAGLVIQYPGADGGLRSLDAYTALCTEVHDRGGLVTAAADLLALALLTPPGEWGADIAVGTSQRFGVPMGYGGPHAGYMVVRAGLERALPGRLVGASVDADGHLAYRLALQTREQHIRREKATSNICTAQVLLAVMAGMYAVWHGPDGLRRIATQVHAAAAALAAGLQAGGVELTQESFFDTVTARVPGRADEVWAAAREAGVTLRLIDADTLGISCDETTTAEHLTAIWAAFGVSAAVESASAAGSALPASLLREGEFLTHPVFHQHHSETSLLRYLRRLADADYALDRGMIPLGSCTMKLNATTEMIPVTWPEFGRMHPFAPAEDAAGYADLISTLEGWLAEVTGYAAVSVQPNAGSQGELAGLLAIRAYHRSRGDAERDVCLIPSSAHGTNAASAVMAGMRVVVVKAHDDGTVDLDDLAKHADTHADRLAAIMVTYPSTHGVFEEGITEISRIVRGHGGQVYVDGANLNALLGLARLGDVGDVSHLNLHKTFCIPHGGGGPGVGPVAVAAHLAPFLPSHPLHPDSDRRTGIGPVSAAPHGSASILPISWTYVRMMGGPGLTQATQVAILTANYVAKRLGSHFPVLYTGQGGLVAHECILDLRPLTKATGVTVDDVAKRLIDYGFHAPTMSFPVAGTLMVEPTESEDLAELDRFCEAMIAIRGEADRVAAGDWPADDNPLVNAPHTARCIAADWAHPYDREVAVYPSVPGSGRPVSKYWPPVRRIDGAYGDRNLFCSCPTPEDLS